MAQLYEILVQARDEASKTFDRVADNAVRASRKVEAATQEGGLRGLKRQFGEESTLGLGVKTLMGAGALAGVGMLSNALGDAAEKMAELSKKYMEGKVSGKEMFGSIIEGIPIFGDLTRAVGGTGEALLELLGVYQKMRDLTFAEEIGSARLNPEVARRKAIEQSVADGAAAFDARQAAAMAEGSGANPADAAIARREAQYQQELREIESLRVRQAAADPTRDFRNEAIEREIKAEQDYQADIREIRQRADDAESARRMQAKEKAHTDFQKRRDEALAEEAEQQEKEAQQQMAHTERMAKIREAVSGAGNYVNRAIDFLGSIRGGPGAGNAADGGRVDPSFSLNESRQLTGVRGSSPAEDIPRKQFEEVKKQTDVLADVKAGIDAIVAAAQNGKVLFANLRGTSNAG